MSLLQLNLHSSMERLKVDLNDVQEATEFHLHSSMERLKVLNIKCNSNSALNLHSSMERLKVERAGSGKGNLPIFTFQYGEIKRLGNRCRNHGADVIYIPVWRD